MSAKKTNPEADALPYEGMPDKVTIPKKPGKVPPPEDPPEETAVTPEPYWGP